jgi:hypothetical protein
VGHNIELGAVRGYPIDLTVKAAVAHWPPPFVLRYSEPPWQAVFQWGLGCYERYLDDGDERGLEAATRAGRYALEGQRHGGHLDGAWFHHEPFPHTFTMPSPWLSAMAQGEGASLLVRLYGETGEEVFADSALRALGPLAVPSEEGGVQALLGGRPFPEEYPTSPPSFVLNGAVFALWGVHDVAVALDDPGKRRAFSDGVDTLADEIHRWDLGYWSRYDLFPHPVVNVASSFYHDLHINQLTAMHRIAPRPQLHRTAERFRGYTASRSAQARGFAGKVLFRLAVPRSQRLARGLPWAQPV